jgi:hypothetical protein
MRMGLFFAKAHAALLFYHRYGSSSLSLKNFFPIFVPKPVYLQIHGKRGILKF